MGDADLDRALYARMRWNTPLSAEHADLLMDRLELRPGLRIADLGCGWGNSCSFTQADVAAWRGTADRVLCIGPRTRSAAPSPR
jgi:Mycolic acid cyclopropane synthetase